MSVADFRSDTLTRPTAAMRQAMAQAEVGDDVLDGDPTVRALEQRVAAWVGQSAALYVPSGTMANQIALGVWTRPGDEIVVQRYAHVTTHEAGSPGYLHGLQSITIGGADGVMPAAEARAAIRPRSIHVPRTALFVFEQTHNMAGGRVAPLTEWDALIAVAREAEVPVHLDGARLANAVVASGESAGRLARGANSVSVCLSKGLGAPVGSVVCGDDDFIEAARLIRKRLGGWMRQAGIIAAAGLYALEHHLERLAEDHALARQLAEGAAVLPGIEINPRAVATNIVMLQLAETGADAATLAARLADAGVLALPMGERLLRFTTHMDVGPQDVERALAALCRA